MEERFPDQTTAVVAHGLLNSMAIINGAARTLRDSGEVLGAPQRAQLLSMIVDQAEHVAGMLGDLARGLPPGIVQELEALNEERPPSPI